MIQSCEKHFVLMLVELKAVAFHVTLFVCIVAENLSL